jgi:diaminopimelate decarboxylase
LVDLAQKVGTPCYVYSYATLSRHYRVFEAGLGIIPHQICYSVKANPSGAILSALAALGAGADVVSGGELMRALRAGIAPGKIVFSGVGKQASEMEAALRARILMFNVESEDELELLNQVAGRMGAKAPIALRVNPDVDPGTHPYISTGLRQNKFGIPVQTARAVYLRALEMDHVVVRGIDSHIGSQLTTVAPIVDALRPIVELAQELQERGVPLQFIDVGGGLGIRYGNETPPSPAEYGATIASVMAQFAPLKLQVICEPGRVIMGNAGILLTQVQYLKSNGDKRFIIVDAAMNDLLRPALYDAYHEIQPVEFLPSTGTSQLADVVGPICESADFLARDRSLPPVRRGELLAIMSAGAYGYSMSSNYNSRHRAAEVLVRDRRYAVIRRRESDEDLVRGEVVPDWVGEVD